MRNYFETKHQDRYNGYITMHDGRVMQYGHTKGKYGPEPYLMDVETGEIYLVLYVLSDEEHEIFVTDNSISDRK